MQKGYCRVSLLYMKENKGVAITMSVRCKTSEELGKAIKNHEEFIEIEGD